MQPNVSTAFGPFAKKFLIVARDAQSVTPINPVISGFLDTRAESIWFNIQRSLSPDNPSLIRGSMSLTADCG